ncbi:MULTISPECIES: TRAP transporter substrate-binding protein [unclassified Pseudoclavibacter]|uniref:TRAP transporter substrate-binding protein n=1 Tax=unclassified Pseudoclavibacter TaxID=2615177 RepID=UPI001BA7F799|nr:TRAP transporter substrate-binding protein [Pseudoclavibacter sp. Marseille-Q4354]MBS3180094.1 TRAP transporter substrate-binding protein [Pseudoclavibacter sp. Marseille-Q4354]
MRISKISKIGAIAGVAIAGLTLSACSGSGAGGGAEGGAEPGVGELMGSEKAFRVAFNQSVEHPQAQALLEFSDELYEATDGRFSLDLYTDEVLGDQASTIEQVQSGTIDFAMIAGSLLENFEPDFSVVNLPYLYDSPEHQMQVLNDDAIMGDLYGAVEDDSIKVLSAFHGGVRNVYSSKGAVETPADLAGQKIRVIGSDTNVKMMELMGGVGTPMAQGEVFTAIQSGVLDGAENNELIYSSLSHDEIAPFYSQTQHLMMPDYLIAGTTVWDGIEPDVQATMTDLLAASSDRELELFAEAVDAAKGEAEEAGATFNEVDVETFREATLPLHEERVTNERTQAIYDAIEAARS